MKANKEKLDFYKMVVANKDISDAEVGFRSIIDQGLQFDSPVFRLLVFGAVISYARPFVGNKMYGKLPAKWERFSSKTWRQAHKKLIKLRHNIVAHNDWLDVKVYMFPPGSTLTIVNQEDQTKVEWALDEMSHSVATPGVHHDEIEIYLELCVHLNRTLLEEIRKAKDGLFIDEKLPKEPFLLNVFD